MGGNQDPEEPTRRPRSWSSRHDAVALRAFAAKQREQAAIGRRAAALIREEAAFIRAEAARVRDDGARTRDDAARVRDQAALVRDEAARARDAAAKSRSEAMRRRILNSTQPVSREGWAELIALDRLAESHAETATTRDREASSLDRKAAEKDREAAERDRAAANSDRAAADRDRDAADQDRAAAENDREAADADLDCSDAELLMAEKKVSRTDRLSSLGRVSAGIAHELNTPLATLQSNLAVLEERFASLPPAELSALLADLRLSSDRIAGVVQDMKTWVRGDDVDAPRTPIQLAALLEASLKRVEPALDGRVRVTASFLPVPEVWGVASRLDRAFTSLLINAAHAMPEGRADNEIAIKVFPAGEDVIVEVRDNGVGIAPDALPHLFDPFYSTRDGEGGTGLGLAMCEQIISDHGGSITVESTQGKGTLFQVALPTDAKTRAPPERIHISTNAMPQVLVIDDDPALIRSISRTLFGRCEVTTAFNGQEGLERILAAREPWTLVLCDMTMPVLNGREFHQQLLRRSPELAARVVFMSGGAISDETHAFLASIPNPKLEKPFTTRALLALLEQNLERH